jgi:adenosylmethionine-8-amino-7-oxononanoate aminotransferase
VQIEVIHQSRQACARHQRSGAFGAMRRPGTLHACEQEDISPDLMAIAKGLGGCYAPIGALLVQEKIFDAVAGCRLIERAP